MTFEIPDSARRPEEETVEHAVDLIRVRDSSSWWIDHPNGSVTLLVLRRVGAAEGGTQKLLFSAVSEEVALAGYGRYCEESAARSNRQAERRSKWGPQELRSV